MNEQTPSMMKPALIAGAAAGFIAAIPYIGWFNFCCCAWVVMCGLLAAFMQSSAHAKLSLPFSAKDGAVVGLASGMVYGIVNGVFQRVFFTLLNGPEAVQQTLDKMAANGMDPEALEISRRIADIFVGPGGALIAFFVALLAGAIFATIGGLIGGALFKKEGTPPPTMATPPPPAPLV